MILRFIGESCILFFIYNHHNVPCKPGNCTQTLCFEFDTKFYQFHQSLTFAAIYKYFEQKLY